MRKQTCWILLLSSLIPVTVLAQATRPTLPPPPPPARQCRVTTTYQGGIPDNFAGGPDPRVWSPALTAYFSNKATRQYDEDGCDRYLGESFLINKCLICETLCQAEIEVTYKSCGSSLDCNDNITIGQAPFNGTGGTIITSAPLYSPGCTTPTPDGVDTAPNPNRTVGTSITPNTRRFPIDVTKLKALCARTKGASFWLDVVIQDDTNVDSMKLILTHN